MKFRFCYPLLVPIRLLIAFITFSTVISIFVGKRLSQDTPPPSAPSDSTASDAATEDFYPDSAQAAVNSLLLIATLYMLYRPQTRYWWLTSNFRLTVISWGFAIIGCYYALSQYIRIMHVHGGCESNYFRYTRMRCWIQLGASAGQVGWAALLILESFIMVKQKNDRKWNEQRADEEIQGAVMYQPDLSAPSWSPVQERENREYDSYSEDNLEMESRTGAGIGNGPDPREQSYRVHSETTSTVVEEHLPEYESRRPRNQPLIVDTTHPPPRLAGAIARRMISESVAHTSSGDAPISPIPQSHESPPLGSPVAESVTTANVLPPPPNYTP
ncbi:hypothetical protein FBU30_001743 [Linnemannia zychae]|nr:hypothetical protein FBU30_001743 [Linnemannia zychae]